MHILCLGDAPFHCTQSTPLVIFIPTLFLTSSSLGSCFGYSFLTFPKDICHVTFVSVTLNLVAHQRCIVLESLLYFLQLTWVYHLLESTTYLSLPLTWVYHLLESTTYLSLPPTWVYHLLESTTYLSLPMSLYCITAPPLYMQDS